MNRLLTYHNWLKKQLWRSCRILLRHCQLPVRLGPKASRHKSCGKIGSSTAFVIHSGTSRAVASNKEVAEIIQASENRFQNGCFFNPIAKQVAVTGAVVSARIQQGEGEERRDHVSGIYVAK